MTELYLVRHADAGDPEAWTRPDAERPLSDKGRRQAQRLGAFLARLGFAPDRIVSSPKLRALDTARIVGDAIGLDVQTDDALAGPFGLDELRALVAKGHADQIVIVGHDPDFSELLAELVGAPELPMKKGALARVDLPRSIAPAAGILRWLIPPDVLRQKD